MKQTIFSWMILAGCVLSLAACMAYENYNPQLVGGKIRRHSAAAEPVGDAKPAGRSAAKQQEGSNAATLANGQAAMDEDCLPAGVNGEKVFLQTDRGNEKVERLKVGADGYGAPPKNYYPEGQRRLMTIRASKVDAYRALAEVVGGLHIWGGTAIADMVVERDRYRLFIDTYVRGARVTGIDLRDDGTVKTSVEMEVSQRFLSQVMAFVDPTAAKRCASGATEETGRLTYVPVTGAAASYYYSE